MKRIISERFVTYAANEKWPSTARITIKMCDAINQTLTSTKIERLNTNPVGNAFDEGDKVMDAAVDAAVEAKDAAVDAAKQTVDEANAAAKQKVEETKEAAKKQANDAIDDAAKNVKKGLGI